MIFIIARKLNSLPSVCVWGLW